MHSPHNTPRKRSRSGPIAVLVLFAVLVLYPLSEGPVYRIAGDREDCYISVDTFDTIYAPSSWVYRQLPYRAREPFDWWMGLRYDDSAPPGMVIVCET